MTKREISIEQVQEATPEIAASVEALMPDLSERLAPDPVSLNLLKDIITSPDRDLFIARLNG